MHLAARAQQRVKIGSRDGGGKSYNLDVVTRVKQQSAARAHDAGHQYPLPVGRHARPRPENAIALRIRVLQAEPTDKFEDLVPEERAQRASVRDRICQKRENLAIFQFKPDQVRKRPSISRLPVST
jgi:hypothetical protein